MRKPGAIAAALLAGLSLAAPPAEAAFAPPGYAYGYGTYYVALCRSIPPTWGDASNWPQRAQADGFKVNAKPAPGAIAWTAAKGPNLAHVAYVEVVTGDYVTVSEMFFHGGWGRVTYRTVPAGSFLYID